MAIKVKKPNKNPPILSHEFIIQNHADIVGCIDMLFVVGLMVQATSPFCSKFVSLQYAASTDKGDVYGSGLLDLCNLFFATLLLIAIHAAIQEYLLDKITKKLHLSKVKHSQFNESGQLLILYIISFVWATDIILKNNLLFNVSSLWSDYPQKMTFSLKAFYITQISYWIHCYPELYFQKTKRSEMLSKIKTPTLYLIFISTLYFLNFNRVGVVLLFLNYCAEATFHAARIYNIVDKEEKNSKAVQTASDIIFLVVQVNSVLLTLLTFLYGFSQTETQGIDLAEGSFNILPVRLFMIALCFGIQGYLLFSYGADSIRQLKNFNINIKLPSLQSLKSSITKAASRSKSSKKKSIGKKKDRTKTGSDNELTEADQNIRKILKNKRATKAK